MLKTRREDPLCKLADEADKHGYKGYADYCRLRFKKNRTEALEKLSKFIDEIKAESPKRQRAFADWILTFCFHNPEVIDACPLPLRRDLLAPIVASWTEAEPDNPKALRWNKDERALLVAARALPPDEIAIGRYAMAIINRVDFAHDASEYSSDEAKSDLAEIQGVLQLLYNIPQAPFFQTIREDALILKVQLQKAAKQK
jgi:hypothetical protein